MFKKEAWTQALPPALCSPSSRPLSVSGGVVPCHLEPHAAGTQA